MSKIKLFLFSLVAIALNGCAYFEFDHESEIVPEDFIVRQDTSYVLNQINELEASSEHIVRFTSGKSELSEREKTKILRWLQNSLPSMITVRGTGGAEKYKDLGDQRGLAVINFLQSSQADVEILLLDYSADLPGGRAILQMVPPSLASTVRQQAPILIIKSS